MSQYPARPRPISSLSKLTSALVGLPHTVPLFVHIYKHTYIPNFLRPGIPSKLEIMATIATLPFAKVPRGYNKDFKEHSSKTSQPTRSMTHPLHDPAKASNAKRRVKNGEPFDPEELTRRLTAYVAEQKLQSQQRREARAAKERAAAQAAGHSATSPTDPKAPHDAVYHHVPAVAAAAFQRTATPNIVTTETVHKLAAPVLKAALSPSNPDDMFPNPSTHLTRQKSTQRPTTSLQRTVLQDHAEVEKERIRNRNQFQRTQALEEAAEVDELRDVYRIPQRTFSEFAHLRNALGKGHSRPLSTGDLFSDSEDTDTMPSENRNARLKSLRVKPTYDGRNDWAQKEDEDKSPVEKEGRRSGSGGGGNGRTVRERVSGPFLRRKESVWVLMGKKEKTKQDVSLIGMGIGECTSPPPLNGKKGLFARFKRHPS